MAGCSSSVGIAHFKSLENGVVPFECFSSKSVLATRFRCFSINGTRTNTRLICKSKKQSLVVVNVTNPATESKSGGVECVEKDAANGVDKSYLSTPDGKSDAVVVGGDGDGGGYIDGSGGNGKFSGGGGGGGGRDDGGEDYEEREFGPLLKFDEVIREMEARGASLPADMLEAAKTGIEEIASAQIFGFAG